MRMQYTAHLALSPYSNCGILFQEQNFISTWGTHNEKLFYFVISSTEKKKVLHDVGSKV